MCGTAFVRPATLVFAAAFFCVTMAQAQEAAHKMAEKFSGAQAEAKKKESDAAKSKDDERKAADAKKKEDAAKKKEADRKAAEARKLAAEARKRAEAAKAAAGEARRRAEDMRRTDEAEMLARARREAEEMKATEEIRRLIEQAERERAKAEELLATQGAEQARGKADAQARNKAADEEFRRLADQAAAERARLAELEQLAQLRAAEHRRVVQTLQKARQIRAARILAQSRRRAEEEREIAARSEPPPPPAAVDVAPPPVSTPPPAVTAALPRLEPSGAEAGKGVPPPPASTDVAVLEPQSSIIDRHVPTPVPTPVPRREDVPPARISWPPTTSRGIEERVTVLVVLTPGSYGIRRGANNADPVLCMLDGCYVSKGPDTPAQFMPDRRALSFANTWGARAAACRNALGCVFRNIPMEVPGYLQPVDLHFLRHDRRRGQIIIGDSDCRLEVGRLACRNGIHAEDYAMWVMPESLAIDAGPAALQRALIDGLTAPPRSAALSYRGRR